MAKAASTLILLAPVTVGCKTMHDGASSVAAAEIGDGGYQLGPVTNDDFRAALYNSLAHQMEKEQSVGEGAEETTELGDIDNFLFKVVRLTKDGEDIAPGESPDGMEVDATGWYKRTLTQGDTSTPECHSFDADMTLVQRGDEWVMSTDQPATIGREDAEDCY